MCNRQLLGVIDPLAGKLLAPNKGNTTIINNQAAEKQPDQNAMAAMQVESARQTSTSRRFKSNKSLRIDLNSAGSTGAGGYGLNIPA